VHPRDVIETKADCVLTRRRFVMQVRHGNGGARRSGGSSAFGRGSVAQATRADAAGAVVAAMTR
jgi:hypothetical protein